MLFYLHFLFRLYYEIYSESPIAYQFSKNFNSYFNFSFLLIFWTIFKKLSDLSNKFLYKHSCYFAIIYSAKYFCLWPVFNNKLFCIFCMIVLSTRCPLFLKQKNSNKMNKYETADIQLKNSKFNKITWLYG